jgi:hypothetical protein
MKLGSQVAVVGCRVEALKKPHASRDVLSCRKGCILGARGAIVQAQRSADTLGAPCLLHASLPVKQVDKTHRQVRLFRIWNTDTCLSNGVARQSAVTKFLPNGARDGFRSRFAEAGSTVIVRVLHRKNRTGFSAVPRKTTRLRSTEGTLRE